MDQVKETVHTSVAISIIGGVIFGILGFIVSPIILSWMGTPENIVDMAALYLKLYFLGLPAMSLYNFGSSILRSLGDTKRPLFYLIIGGIVNVVLNLIFVAGFGMDVEGVALATIISQYLSMAAALYLLFDPKGDCAMKKRELKMNGESVEEIVRIGVPTGINGIVFSLSNVILQSTVNSFGDVIMAANSVSGSISGFVCLIAATFSNACVSFAGQCCGAKQYKRIDSLLLNSIACSVIGVCAASLLVTLIPRVLLGLYTNNPDVIDNAVERMVMVSWGYVLYAVGESTSGCLRGMGYSTMPTVLNICGICLPRVLWVFFIFPLNPTFFVLNICYPVSWFVSAVMQVIYYLHCRKKKQALFAA
jgi:putative MATE family efflux protein